VDIGEWIVGLRSNDEEVVDLLRRGLASIRVDDIDVFPNLSLYRSDDDRRVREMHRLYRRGVTVLRTGSIGRVLRSAVRHLDSFLTPPDGFLALRADLLVGQQGAVLVNDSIINLNVSERRTAKMGWVRLQGAAPMLDLHTLEVVVPPPRFGLDPSVLAEIDARWPPDADEVNVAPGRYPVRGVVLLGTRPDHLLVASPARRVASFASLLDTSTRAARAIDVQAVGQLDDRVEVVRALGFDPKEITGILRDLSR
jgi:hypothetical protein